MSTGSELVEPGEPIAGGKIPDSNSFMLAAAANAAGAIAYRIGFVPDEPKTLITTIEDQLIRADLVITTGGVSVGAYDVVKEALGRMGTVSFDRVAMQPGMPQGFGTIGPDSTPIFTLPGNPVSAFVSFEMFVRPVLRRMQALEPLHRPTVRAVLKDAVQSPAGKRQFLRGDLGVEDGRYVVGPVGGPGSHLLAGLANANCLIVVPEETTHVAAGDAVDGDHARAAGRLSAMSEFTHLDERGAARMVDVSGKDVSVRTASASGRVLRLGRGRRSAARGRRAQG